jgi:DNA-directed RNA polymerase subunit RPC12/RpoP
MFCPNCGEKLGIESQNYCQNCGSEILEKSQTFQAKSQTPQAKYGLDQERTTSSAIPVTQYPTHVKREGEPGSYSKICLGFGIVSLVIGVISFNIGSPIVLNSIYMNYIFVRRVFIGLSVVHIVGIIFGIVSKVNSRKAKGLEPESSILKAGSTMGVIGIVINSLLMAIAFTFIL